MPFVDIYSTNNLTRKILFSLQQLAQQAHTFTVKLSKSTNLELLIYTDITQTGRLFDKTVRLYKTTLHDYERCEYI